MTIVHLLVVVALLSITLAPQQVFADDIGSSVISVDARVHIDAKLVDSPSDVISSNSQRPVLFGYTVKNVSVELFSDGVPIGNAHTDDTGYWRFAPTKNLLPGKHALAMQLTDPLGVSGEITPIASVRIPVQELKPSYGIPIPSAELDQLNYITVPLLILAVAAAGGTAYLLVKKHVRHGVKP